MAGKRGAQGDSHAFARGRLARHDYWRMTAYFRSRSFLAAILLLALGMRISDAADLSVVGASPTSGGAPSLSLVVEDADLDWPIILRRNDSGQTPIEVRVDVTPLIGPSARPADNLGLAIDGQPPGQMRVDLPPLGQAVIRLSGKLGFEGAYKGELGVIDGVLHAIASNARVNAIADFS